MSAAEALFDLHWQYPATLENVERVCLAVTVELEKLALSKQDQFATELLLREAVNNAVIHGCRLNPLQSFSCRVAVSDQEAMIEVQDSGSGFDWRKASKSRHKAADVSGRGLSICALYAQSIKFNEAGNCVTLTRTFQATAAGNRQGEKNE